jgi:hypothetical protein
MRKNQREYSNREYFESLEETLYLITHRPDPQESISKIQAKLKGSILNIFDTIILYYCGTRIAKLKKQESQKRLKYTEIKEFTELIEQCEIGLDNYLESIDKLAFLEAVSEIIYWVTKVEGARQIKIHKEYLSSWIEWHRYLERKNKNLRKGQQIREKLRILIGDKVDNFDHIYDEYINEIERFKAGKKSISINIDHEIDVKKAKPNGMLFLPERYIGEGEGFRIIDEHMEFIILNNERYTLKKYYNLIKDEINEGWLKSEDLLKQIMTVYLIKRCQNGDEESFQKLFDLYKDNTIRITQKYSKERGELVDPIEVEGCGSTILASLLKGDNPSYLYKTLGYDRSSKKGIDVINKKPYVALNESYEYMFSMISEQLNHLQTQIKDLEKEVKDYRNRSKNAKKIQTKKEYYIDTFMLSSHVLSRINFSPTLFALINPLDLLRISPNYNKWLFKPNPNGNLTTWLFGVPGAKFKGMIWQFLRDSFEGRENHNNESFDEDKYIEDNDSGIYKKIQRTDEDY